MIGRLQWQGPSNGRVERRLHFVAFIGKQCKDRAQIHPGGMKELQSVGLGSRHGFFVGVNATSPKWFEADACEKTLANVADPLDLVFLVVDVEAPGRVLL